jgi:hypothetical protein
MENAKSALIKDDVKDENKLKSKLKRNDSLQLLIEIQ